ncbi:MAG: penicillin-binding transpeptidase domain-containing protein [Chloroflexota bacterium]
MNHTSNQNWRMTIIYALMGLIGVVFIGRLLNLQILQGTDWVAQAEDNRTDVISVPPPRGIIYDRNGIVLARNIASYNIIITPAFLPDDTGDVQRIYRELSDLTGVPVNRGTVDDAKLILICTPGPGIAQLVELGTSLAPYSPVKIQCNVGETIAMIVRERSLIWPGVGVEIEPIRDYTTGSLTATLIGFLGPIPAIYEELYRDSGFEPGRDRVGYAGIELSMDEVLLGVPGRRVVEVDVAGQVLRNLEPPIDPISGDNVVLTIDTRLQQAASAALQTEIDSWNAYYGETRISSGVVIALNPQTGEVLAMAQYPTYENNRLARFIPYTYYQQLDQDPRHPLLNFAITNEIPPGSTFKLSTALGALNEGVVNLTQIIEAPGELLLTESFSPTDPGNVRPFVDWFEPGFGEIDFLHCIAFSSNVCFYKLGGGYQDEIPEGLGILRLQQYARALGYDRVSGIQLPGEAAGLIPDPIWKRRFRGENWSTGDTYIASVGQGYVLSTPLQVLLSAAIVANDGQFMQPTIIRSIIDDEGHILERWWNPTEFTVTDSPLALDSYQISPFIPNLRWDMTIEPIIQDFACEDGYCTATGLMKIVEPWVIENIQRGMRMAVTESQGTLNRATSFQNYPISVAGKTGSAEYCDDVALANNRCTYGAWPTHSWTVAYAPFDNPEIVIIAFCYNGGEGASVAAPIVKLIMDAYFELKAVDIAGGLTGTGP